MANSGLATPTLPRGYVAGFIYFLLLASGEPSSERYFMD